MPGWRRGGSRRECSGLRAGRGSSEGLPAAPEALPGQGACGEAAAALGKAELPPEPGLKSLRCGDWTVTGRPVGKKKGGHW